MKEKSIYINGKAGWHFKYGHPIYQMAFPAEVYDDINSGLPPFGTDLGLDFFYEFEVQFKKKALKLNVEKLIRSFYNSDKIELDFDEIENIDITDKLSVTTINMVYNYLDLYLAYYFGLTRVYGKLNTEQFIHWLDIVRLCKNMAKYHKKEEIRYFSAMEKSIAKFCKNYSKYLIDFESGLYENKKNKLNISTSRYDKKRPFTFYLEIGYAVAICYEAVIQSFMKYFKIESDTEIFFRIEFVRKKNVDLKLEYLHKGGKKYYIECKAAFEKGDNLVSIERYTEIIDYCFETINIKYLNSKIDIVAYNKISDYIRSNLTEWRLKEHDIWLNFMPIILQIDKHYPEYLILENYKKYLINCEYYIE